jgi:signal transduction histidine kinase
MVYAAFYLVALIVALVVSIVVFLIALTHHKNNARNYFVWMMGLVVFWILDQVVYFVILDHGIKYFLNELKFIAIASVPLLNWMVVMRLFHIKRQVLPLQLIVLAQCLFLFLIATNPSHLLFRYNIRYVDFGEFIILLSDYNVGFWAFMGLTYYVMLLTIWDLIGVVKKGSKNQREQAYLFIFASVFPVILNLTFVFFLNQMTEDVTPLGFAVTGSVLLYGIFFHKLLDIVIRSRNIIFEHMDDILIIVNDLGRVVDLNPQSSLVFPGIQLGDIFQSTLDKYLKRTEHADIYTGAQLNADDLQYFEVDRNNIMKGVKTVGYMIYIRNVTEQIRLKNALLLQQEQIEKDLVEKNLFIQYLMKHTRNDVFRMDGLLLMGTVDLPSLKKIADSALSLIKDQIVNVESFMSFEKGQMQLRSEPCLIESELNRYFELIQFEAQKKGLKFIVEVEDIPERLNIDFGKLKQILTNVLMNAIKFTEEGLIKVYIRSNVRDLIFTVSDTGQGMSEEGLVEAMHAFRQADDKSVLKGGYGLGFTLVKELVTLMGGRFNVESHLGQGTRVNFHVQYAPYDNRIAKEELGLKLVREVLSELDIGILTDDYLFDAHIRYQLKEMPRQIISLGSEKIKFKRMDQNFFIVDQSWLENHLDDFIEHFEFRLLGQIPMIVAVHDLEGAFIPSGNCHVLLKPFMAYDLYKLMMKIA